MKGNTKKCKFCCSEIDSKAKVCPVCGRAQKGHGCLVVTLLAIVVMSFSSMVLTFTPPQNDEYITLDEYNQIQAGMTYEEVREIVGSAGTVSAETSMAGIHTFMVTWYGNPSTGSNASITFQNDAVISKAQFGLR